MSEKPGKEEAMAAVRTILSYIGENPDREGLLETPARVVKSLAELYKGYGQDPAPIMKTFKDGSEDVDEMVIQRNIPFFSTCEHHMLPFFGVAHVAYLPDKRIVGLSKMARLVDLFSRRLQVQERLTNQVADAMMETLSPKGAACVIQATHLCMIQRGVAKHHTDTITSCVRGCFKNAKTRSEFLDLIKFGALGSV